MSSSAAAGASGRSLHDYDGAIVNELAAERAAVVDDRARQLASTQLAPRPEERIKAFCPVEVPVPPHLDDAWAMVGGSMQHVLEAAGPARDRFSDLIED